MYCYLSKVPVITWALLSLLFIVKRLTLVYLLIILALRPSQMDSQVDASWVYLLLRLARPWVHLRWLAMTCAHFGRVQICTQVDASFSPFGHPTQVNESWVTSINLLLANEIQGMLAFKWVFATCVYLLGNLRVCLPIQVSTHVQLAATCDYLRFRLARALAPSNTN